MPIALYRNAYPTNDLPIELMCNHDFSNAADAKGSVLPVSDNLLIWRINPASFI